MPQPQQLPGPNADIWDWQMAGHCRGVDSSMFFHPDGERGRARAQREMRAKELCRSCPVITQCRSHALAVGMEEHRRIDSPAVTRHLPIPDVGVGSGQLLRLWHVKTPLVAPISRNA